MTDFNNDISIWSLGYKVPQGPINALVIENIYTSTLLYCFIWKNCTKPL